MSKLILGTMNFGIQTDLRESTSIVSKFIESGCTEFDTAYVYNGGQSEQILGQIIKDLKITDHKVATKVNPRVTGKLDKSSINSQVEESLERLQLEAIDTLYIHFPDESTPILETLEALNELHTKGKFVKFGLSNYSAWKFIQIIHLCKENNWVTPSVYQGLYNPLSRAVESELIPALREYGLSFCAYNPLAGGLLAGKYSDVNDTVTDGRFSVRPNYKARYWNQKLFTLIDLLKSASAESELSIIESSFKWLESHSMLTENDGVLLGVSSTKQLQSNLTMFNGERLPKNIVEVFSQCWAEVKGTYPPYFRTPD